MNLLKEIEHHPLCGDGSIRTLLIERGAAADCCVEELCLSKPDMIREVHRAYLAAGARIIETNSFGANAIRLTCYGLAGHVNEINWQAAQLARQSGKRAFVAGTVGPLGISSATAITRGIDRKECFRTQMGALLDSGVDLIFLKSFQELDELLLALGVKHSLHHCPAICSLTPDENGELRNGMCLEDAFASLARAEADIVGINCGHGPQQALRLVERLAHIEAPLAVFSNAGRSSCHESDFRDSISPEYFAETAALMLARDVRILGGCCGTTPAHIAGLANVLSAERRG
jgi:methionine synthase I (cobalamin-dependent)